MTLFLNEKGASKLNCPVGLPVDIQIDEGARYTNEVSHNGYLLGYVVALDCFSEECDPDQTRQAFKEFEIMV